MFERGYLTLRARRGLALRLHVSIPLVGLVLTWFRPSLGAWVGFLFLLGIHAVGHVAAAALFGSPRLGRLDIHGLGGHCAMVGLGLRTRRLIACGGIVAQLALALLVVVVLRPLADTPFEIACLDMLVGPSLLLAGLNVLPIPPLDGASFWSAPRTVADMEDDEPESFDNPRPQRNNPAPPRRDWFARVQARSARARAAEDTAKLDSEDLDDPELSPEAADSVDRLFRNVRDRLQQ